MGRLVSPDVAGLARAVAVALAWWLAIGAAIVLAPLVAELVAIR
jgi:hypothetical protein